METKVDWIPIPATVNDLDAITTLWEACVRATHWFLPGAEVEELKPLVRHQYLTAVNLFKVNDLNGKVAGFLGIISDKVEMLFVDPSCMGKGVGKVLMFYAIEKLGARRVDVNEQNNQALGFYLRLGFEVKSRSPLDGAGKPYPILHLERPH